MPTDLLRAGSVCGLGSDVHGYISPVSLPDFVQLPVPLHSQMAQRKSGLAANLTMLFFELTRLHVKRGS